MEFIGTVHKFGNHIDTDVIIPARYLNEPDPQVLATHCMEDIDPEFINHVQKGDIIVGGVNFGCGSSREHAPVAIQTVGVSCIIAESFGRIFYRNAINIGLPVLECEEAARDAKNGDQFKVDLDTGKIENITQGRSYTAVPFPEFMQNIINAGGLVPFTKKRIS